MFCNTQFIMQVALLCVKNSRGFKLAKFNIFFHKLKVWACMYGTAKKKRPGYLVGNLVATNWPIEKALHAIGYNQIPTK